MSHGLEAPTLGHSLVNKPSSWSTSSSSLVDSQEVGREEELEDSLMIEEEPVLSHPENLSQGRHLKKQKEKDSQQIQLDHEVEILESEESEVIEEDLSSSTSGSDEFTESSLTSSDSSVISWIAWFTSLPGHDLFLEVPEEFIEDDFNLTGFNNREMLPLFDFCLDTILDLEPQIPPPPNVSHKEIETNAGILYGLIHARFLLTKLGLSNMKKRVEEANFGHCPRTLCGKSPLCPVGRYDEPAKEAVKMYCARCRDVYWPKETRYNTIDGAFFGSTFPHLLYLTYPNLIPPLQTRGKDPSLVPGRGTWDEDSELEQEPDLKTTEPNQGNSKDVLHGMEGLGLDGGSGASPIFSGEDIIMKYGGDDKSSQLNHLTSPSPMNQNQQLPSSSSSPSHSNTPPLPSEAGSFPTQIVMPTLPSNSNPILSQSNLPPHSNSNSLSNPSTLKPLSYPSYQTFPNTPASGDLPHKQTQTPHSHVLPIHSSSTSSSSSPSHLEPPLLGPDSWSTMPPYRIYVAKVYGFRLSEQSAAGPRMWWLRHRAGMVSEESLNPTKWRKSPELTIRAHGVPRIDTEDGMRIGSSSGMNSRRGRGGKLKLGIRGPSPKPSQSRDSSHPSTPNTSRNVTPPGK